MIKKIAGSMYAHKTNIEELLKELTIEEQQRVRKVLETQETAPYINKFEIVKYNKHNKSISLIDSPDWDTSNEPTVGSSICILVDGTVKKRSGGTQVYHNKWQFVSKDYKGFDIEEAKRRTKEWNSIEGIIGLKNKIGNKSFWHKLLKDNGLEI